MRTHVLMWHSELSGLTSAGSLVTAGDLLFQGSGTDFFALDARNGSALWKISLGGSIVMGPITYSTGGKQYVAAAAGNSLFVFALR